MTGLQASRHVRVFTKLIKGHKTESIGHGFLEGDRALTLDLNAQGKHMHSSD